MPYFWLYNLEEILWRDRKFKIRSIETNHQKMTWNKNPKGFELFCLFISSYSVWYTHISIRSVSEVWNQPPPQSSPPESVTALHRTPCHFGLSSPTVAFVSKVLFSPDRCGLVRSVHFVAFSVPSLEVPSHPRRLWDCWSATLSHCWFNLASRRWFIINACSEMSEWDFMEYLAGSMND